MAETRVSGERAHGGGGEEPLSLLSCGAEARRMERE
jgi:hypothetical protein